MAGVPPWLDKKDSGKDSKKGKSSPLFTSNSKKKDSSSDSSSGGFRFASDPTLPPGQRRVVDKSGKKVAVVKRVGDKWVISGNSQKFDSPQAALKSFSSSAKS